MGANEQDLIVQYASKKAGGSSGQLVLDDVEISNSRDNRRRVGIGNDTTQYIEKGNPDPTFSTTAMLNDAAAKALKNIDDGTAEASKVYVKEGSTIEGSASGMITNDVTLSSSDDGDTTVSIDADLVDLSWTDKTTG